MGCWHDCYLQFSDEETEAQECNATPSAYLVDKHGIKTLNSDLHSLEFDFSPLLDFSVDIMPSA